MQELEDLWKVILEKLELTVSNVSFVMWFKPLKIIDYTENKTLYLGAKSTFAKNQLLKRCFDFFTPCLFRCYFVQFFFCMLSAVWGWLM